MATKTLATTFDKKKIPGIRSIKKHPSIDMEQFKTYKGLFLQKYFIDNGKKPIKMVAFGAKNKSFSKPIVFIIYDLKMQPAIFFEFQDDFDENKFLSIVEKFFKKARFTLPKKKIQMKEGVEEAIPAIMSGIMGAVSVLMLAMYYFKVVKYSAEEHYVNTTVENELNNELFGGQQKKESGFEMFANLENYINLILNKRMNSLILCGPPGMSKTYMVRRTLYFAHKSPGKDYKIEKGSALGLNSIYQLLYTNRGKLLVLDDFDSPLANEDVVNLMKAVTDSYGKRIVSLSPEKKVGAQQQEIGAAPNKFEFTGQIIIITNKKKGDLDLALRSRSPVVEVAFNTKEIIKSMDKLLKFIAPQVPYNIKLEALNYIKTLQKNDPKINVSFRSVKAVIDARVGNPSDWKEMSRLIVDYKGKPVKESLNSSMILESIYKGKK
jgi:hypothetical protein